ncbi:U1 zinc finger domain protein [Penicillium brasilianum]|uniref:U1 zinc finger domain protein n=1 Tax=Penicillium brasilianum TaxID=104259 RepID=A0A1S9S0H0_PENBI|nr:U1 zinc finger domain protein [Penicillium brasilianum]
MAEYWKSAPRIWCKQCKIFIRDTPFEKTQHEASPKHQGSLKRFLRDIHRNNEQQQRETQRAKSEVERLRQAVAGGPSNSDPNASAPWKKTAAPAPKPADRPVSMEDRKKQMAQLAEMGVAIPDEYRGDMALAGEWQTLSETKVEDLEGAAKSIGVRKRKHDGEEEEDEEDDDGGNPSERLVSRGWGSRMRTYPGAENDDDGDLDALLATTKDLKRSKPQVPDLDSEESKLVEEKKPEPASSVPKEEEVAESKHRETDSSSQVKMEEPGNLTLLSAEEKSQIQDAPGPIFKKRKAKVMRK